MTQIQMHAGTVDEWAKWLEACRTGLRRPLGLDMDRRRYWAFGGTAAAWRVWVEEEQGGPWGYYEGVRCVCVSLRCALLEGWQ